MERNVGSLQAAGRLLGGILLLGLAIMVGYLSWETSFDSLMIVSFTGLMGGGILITGVIRWCPVNEALGRNTCGTAQSNE